MAHKHSATKINSFLKWNDLSLASPAQALSGLPTNLGLKEQSTDRGEGSSPKVHII